MPVDGRLRGSGGGGVVRGLTAKYLAALGV